MLYRSKYARSTVWRDLKKNAAVVAVMSKGEVCLGLGGFKTLGEVPDDYVLVFFDGVTGWVAIQNLEEVEGAVP